MDPELYKLLPNGGDWWGYRTENIEDFLQSEVEKKPAQVKTVLVEKKPEVPAQVKLSVVEKKPESIEVFKYVVNKIDPLYSIYSESMQKTVEEMLKEKLQEIVTSPDGMLSFGSRKTRSIIAWLSGNDITEGSETIIAQFLSWILDENIAKKNELNADWNLYKTMVKNGKERRKIVWLLKK